eukprot:8562-Prorocentrum_minimum.AAC.1
MRTTVCVQAHPCPPAKPSVKVSSCHILSAFCRFRWSSCSLGGSGGWNMPWRATDSENTTRKTVDDTRPPRSSITAATTLPGHRALPETPCRPPVDPL